MNQSDCAAVPTSPGGDVPLLLYQLLFDGRLVLTSTPKKPKRRIEDISTWLEAFSVYCLVLVSYFPHRWKDLLQYQLLILRMFRQFSSPVWLSYDRAFRENAAATNLTEEVKPSPEVAKDNAWVAEMPPETAMHVEELEFRQLATCWAESTCWMAVATAARKAGDVGEWRKEWWTELMRRR